MWLFHALARISLPVFVTRILFAKPFAVVERAPLLEGKNLFMILAPSRQGAVKEAANSA